MIMSRSLLLATNGCSRPLQVEVVLHLHEELELVAGLEVGIGQRWTSSQAKSIWKRLRSVELSPGVHVAAGSVKTLLCSSITQCCGDARRRPGGGRAGGPPAQAVDHKLGDIDAVIVLGNGLERDRGLGGAVFRAAAALRSAPSAANHHER